MAMPEAPEDKARREKAAEAILDAALRFTQAFLTQEASVEIVPTDLDRGLATGFEIRLRRY